MNLQELKTRIEDLYEGILEDPKARVIFIACCSFLIGFMVAKL
jgi:hypothetical protein